MSRIISYVIVTDVELSLSELDDAMLEKFGIEAISLARYDSDITATVAPDEFHGARITCNENPGGGG